MLNPVCLEDDLDAGRRVPEFVLELPAILSKDIWCPQGHAGGLFFWKRKSLAKENQKGEALRFQNQEEFPADGANNLSDKKDDCNGAKNYFEL